MKVNYSTCFFAINVVDSKKFLHCHKISFYRASIRLDIIQISRCVKSLNHMTKQKTRQQSMLMFQKMSGNIKMILVVLFTSDIFSRQSGAISEF